MSGSTPAPFSWQPLTASTASCTWDSNRPTVHGDDAVGSAVGLSIQAINEANQNWTRAQTEALSSGNHWNLPQGTHNVATGTITHGNGYIRYEPAGSSFATVVTADGKVETIIR